MIINSFVSNKKLVLDFNNFIVSVDCSNAITRVGFDETNCSLLLNTMDDCKILSIEALLLNQYPYDAEIIGCLIPNRYDIKLYLKAIKSINWLGVIG